jgi:chromosome segregation ATPase
MNEQLNQKIKIIENKIKDTKQALKSWASQISQHHKALKVLTQQLETIKQELTMNKNNINLKKIKNQRNQGGTN